MDETSPSLPGTSPQPKTSGLAITSLVLGILSLLLSWNLLPLLGILGVICGHKALSRIKQSGVALSGRGLAVAGLVTGYIGTALMVVFAIPGFVKASDVAMTNACLSNLCQIDEAKNQWAQEHHKLAADIPAESDLLPYLKDHQLPKCPAGGTYTINQDSKSPTCSITNHVWRVN
jgi:hypothetical protein